MAELPKPRCPECGRPFDLQVNQPVMNGRDRVVALAAGFGVIGAVGLVACLVTCSVKNHAVDSARIAACNSVVAAHNGDVSRCDTARVEMPKSPEPPTPQCSGHQQSYSCCVEPEQAQSLHCWR